MAYVATIEPSNNGEPLLGAWRQWQGSIDCFASGRTWSANELRKCSSDAARILVNAGIAPGDSVALVLANTAAFPIALTALLAIGANPFLVHAGTHEPEFNRLLNELEIAWAIHDFLPNVSNIHQANYLSVETFGVGEVSVALLSMGTRNQELKSAESETGIVLHPTSGTYGRAKYCKRNQHSTVSEAHNFVDSISRFDGGRIAVATPLSHAFAYGFCLTSSWVSDSTLVLDPVFNPKRLLRREEAQPSDLLAVVPPMLKALSRLAALEGHRTLARNVFYAGAACPRDSATDFRSTFDSELFTIYGTTETGGIATSFDSGSVLPGVGKPLRNVSVRLSDTHHYHDLGPGAGEILVNTTSLMHGYLGQGEDAHVGIEWPTQDIGLIDGSGAISIIGRARDIINLGGLKVDPAQVEAVLRTHPGVVDVAVYPGLLSDETEFVQAAVQPRNCELTTEVLRGHCLENLDPYKVPVRFHFVPEIPRSPSGKCLKIRCPEFPKQLIFS